MELFLHPWYMIAGGVLVSAPIIIHLINRMRFKRIRWAAMEFLLKSQKKNQRKLIIEQLLLLLLRILMVLLVAFLVARFVGGASASSGTGVMHAVVIDDTLSMGDRWAKPDGGATNALDKARERVADLVRTTSAAHAAQYIKVTLLSEPGKILLDEQISDRTVSNLEKALADRKPTALHVPAHVGLAKAQEEILGAPQGQKIVHFVSDFRESDWSNGPNTNELNKTVEDLLKNKINISLIDTAHPFRKDTAGVARNHDNACVLSLKAGSRIIPEGVDIPFEIVVRNNGNSNIGPQLVVRVDGREEQRGSILLPSIAPGQDYTHKFDLRFSKQSKAAAEYRHIRAEIRPGETGLEADHVRDLVLELREKIPVLVVDGRGKDEGAKIGGDLFYVEAGINATGSYVAAPVDLAELERLQLETYAAVYLLNVKTIPEKIITKLRAFVEKGGNLAFFLGPEIQASHYNEVLHTANDGLFPVMIDSRPTDPLPPAERRRRLQDDPGKKILYRDKGHPIVREAFALNENLHLLVIDRYHQLQVKSKWVPNAQKETQEILTLPSMRTVDSFKIQAQAMSTRLVEAIDDLAATDPGVEKYKSLARDYKRYILTSLDKEFLFELTLVLDDLLNNPGDKPPEAGAPEEPGKVRRPSMLELWAKPQLKTLAQEINQIRESALFGDPLLVSRPYGKGKVTAFLSSAGPQAVTGQKDTHWNRLAAGDPGSSSTFMPMMIELQLFLTSQMDSQNRIVAADDSGTLDFTFAKDTYGPTLDVRFIAHPDFKSEAGPGQGVPEKPLETVRMTEKEDQYVHTFANTKKPGVYVFEATRTKVEVGQPAKEVTLFAFNVDAEAESDLKRAPRARLDDNSTLREKYKEARMAFFEQTDSFDKFKTKDPDTSESPWLYLLLLVVLICEQALAVHLSFHLKGNEAGAAGATPRMAA